jgi:hypothetical protein
VDTYAFTVTATNALGTGSPSAASAGVVAPAGLPISAAAVAVTPLAQSAAGNQTGPRHRSVDPRAL